jgi:hypothetical protein
MSWEMSADYISAGHVNCFVLMGISGSRLRKDCMRGIVQRLKNNARDGVEIGRRCCAIAQAIHHDQVAKARSTDARRRREFERVYQAQLGHKPSKFELSKVRRCASLATLCELIEVAILSGDERGRTFVPDDLVRCTSALRRAEVDLLGPKPRHARHMLRLP